MSTTTVPNPLATPAQGDPAPIQMALVQLSATSVMRGRMAYPVAAGTVLRLLTLPVINTFQPPPGTALIPAGSYTLGSIVPASALPTPTTIKTAAFVARFTAAEQAAIGANAATLPFMIQLVAYSVINVTNAQVITDMAALVAAGVITQARSTQILNLSLTSP